MSAQVSLFTEGVNKVGISGLLQTLDQLSGEDAIYVFNILKQVVSVV